MVLGTCCRKAFSHFRFTFDSFFTGYLGIRDTQKWHNLLRCWQTARPRARKVVKNPQVLSKFHCLTWKLILLTSLISSDCIKHHTCKKIFSENYYAKWHTLGEWPLWPQARPEHSWLHEWGCEWRVSWLPSSPPPLSPWSPRTLAST